MTGYTDNGGCVAEQGIYNADVTAGNRTGGLAHYNNSDACLVTNDQDAEVTSH